MPRGAAVRYRLRGRNVRRCDIPGARAIPGDKIVGSFGIEFPGYHYAREVSLFSTLETQLTGVRRNHRLARKNLETASRCIQPVKSFLFELNIATLVDESERAALLQIVALYHRRAT